MDRIIAFLITDKSRRMSELTLNHAENIAKDFHKKIAVKNYSAYNVLFIYEGNLENLLEINASEVQFVCGQLGNMDYTKDRYLKIRISDTIKAENDYCGSIPLFYSQRDGVVLSNIEPLVVLETRTKVEDLDHDSVLALLKFSHLIWDRTIYKHIFIQKPDHEYTFCNVDSIDESYKASIKSEANRNNCSGNEIAQQLYSLNKKLVVKAFAPYDEIILPLSAGYDSRLILAAASEDKVLRKRMKCFTYGSEDSIEVQAAMKLAKIAGVQWKRIELPCKFHSENYLGKILKIFGSSLHVHGMYQLEFFDQIQQYIKTDNAVLTSGFMTGVPAGQHSGLLNTENMSKESISFIKLMENFPQSLYWSDENLSRLTKFYNKSTKNFFENQFAVPYELFAGSEIQKSIMFDIWTRQRNFISYYPRTLEWTIPVVSPHMHPDYPNFFMSLNSRHLQKRKAVELMFVQYYKKMASVASNSNNLKSLSNPLESFMLLGSRVMNKFNLRHLVPKKWRNEPIQFDKTAVINGGEESFAPLTKYCHENSVFSELYDFSYVSELIKDALAGNNLGKLFSLQAVAYGFELIEKIKKDNQDIQNDY